MAKKIGKQLTLIGMKRNNLFLIIFILYLFYSCKNEIKNTDLHQEIQYIDTINTYTNLTGKWVYVGYFYTQESVFGQTMNVVKNESEAIDPRLIIELRKDRSFRINDTLAGTWQLVSRNYFNKLIFHSKNPKINSNFTFANSELAIGYNKNTLMRRDLIQLFSEESGKNRIKMRHHIVKYEDYIK